MDPISFKEHFYLPQNKGTVGEESSWKNYFQYELFFFIVKSVKNRKNSPNSTFTKEKQQILTFKNLQPENVCLKMS